MSCASRKHLTKEQKHMLISQRKKAVESRRNRDDKKWKRVLAKMDDAKKKQYPGVGNTLEHGRRRGATRASLRPRTGRKPDNFSIECTVHMSKLMKKKTFHKRAPFAIKKLKAIAAKMMKTKDNRIDASMNTFVWHRGVKGVPGRMRIRVTRNVAEDPEGKSKRKRYYTVISHVPVATYKGLMTKVIDSE